MAAGWQPERPASNQQHRNRPLVMCVRTAPLSASNRSPPVLGLRLASAPLCRLEPPLHRLGLELARS